MIAINITNEETSRKNIPKQTEQEVSKNPSSALKNFGLSELAFQQMLEELRRGDQELFERIFLAHFQDCQKFLIHRYRASPEDAYDATMDTMLVFCKKLKAGKITYGNLRFLYTRMAGQIYMKWIKKEIPKEGIEGLEIEDAPEGLDEEAMMALDAAWGRMCKNCQNLLKAFYYDNTSLKEIALKSGKTAVAIRKQKQRCLEKLQTFFAEHY